MASAEERRRFPRLAHAFLARYLAPTGQGQTWRISPLKDLSRVGACLRCEHPYELGKSLPIQLILPNTKEPLALTARIVWLKRVNPSLNLFEYGIAFDPITPAAQELIGQALEGFLRRPAE